MVAHVVSVAKLLWRWPNSWRDDELKSKLYIYPIYTVYINAKMKFHMMHLAYRINYWHFTLNFAQYFHILSVCATRTTCFLLMVSLFHVQIGMCNTMCVPGEQEALYYTSVYIITEIYGSCSRCYCSFSMYCFSFIHSLHLYNFRSNLTLSTRNILFFPVDWRCLVSI